MRLEIDKLQRLAARRRIGQLLVERPLDPGDAVAVDVGVADDVRREAGLRIEPVGLALERDARLAERIDRLDQSGRGAAAQIDRSSCPT